jgi:hypothetical protein
MIRLGSASHALNTRTGYWSLPGRDGVALLSIPLGASFLFLDPRTTSPNVILGVDAGDGRMFMGPGDVIPVRPGQSTVKVWNPLVQMLDKSLGITFGAKAGLVGFVGLLAGRATELPAIQASAKRSDPVPPAHTIFHGSVEVGIAISLIPTMNLRGLRVYVAGMASATGAWTIPSDFALTLHVAAVHSLITPSQANPTAPPAGVAALPVPSLEEDYPSALGLAHYNRGARLDFSTAALPDHDTVRDLEVPAGCTFMALLASGLAGTGIVANRAILTVEGR